jgi:DNA-binding GntR family transcriptional regulator
MNVHMDAADAPGPMLLNLASRNVSSAGLTVAEAAFRKLLRAVTTGDLKPGSDITEQGLADMLSVSRTPLREALRRLETLGLIVRFSNRTLQVAPLSTEDMRDLSLTREALETLVIREVANRNREGKISLVQLETIHARMGELAAVRDNAFFLDSGLDFHQEVFRLGAVPSAATFLDQIMVRLERYRWLTYGDDQRCAVIVAEHELVLKALRRGDPDAAETAIRQHLDQARKVYLANLGASPKQAATRKPQPAKSRSKA